jgi:nitroreductase
MRMQAIDALLTRHSARALTEPAPDSGALDLILACAARAPDHGRLRPWRFVLIRGAARDRFGGLLAAHLKRSHPDSSPEALERERHKAYRAPLIIAVAARCNTTIKAVPAIEQTLSAGAATHAMMLAAQALGFGSMWKTGGAAYDPQVKTGLGLEASDAVVGFLYLGTDTGERAIVPARDCRELVSELGG